MWHVQAPGVFRQLTVSRRMVMVTQKCVVIRFYPLRSILTTHVLLVKIVILGGKIGLNAKFVNIGSMNVILWPKLLLINPLSANPTKWSNTLKQFVGELPANCLSALDHFVGLALKGLRFCHG